MKTFKQYVEMRDGSPETDEEAKIKMPNDPRLAAHYDTMRKKGKKPGDAYNSMVQHNWQSKKASGMATEAIFDPDGPEGPRMLRHDDRMERLRSIYNKYGDNAYVSFTMLQKLGINPRKNTRKTTPYGIFGYPLGYFLNDVGADFNNLPYGGGFPYMQIFTIEPGANILHINAPEKRINVSKLLSFDQEKLDRMMSKKFDMYEELKSYAQQHGLEWEPERALFQMEGGVEPPSSASLLWILTRWWADDNKAKWTKILQGLGLDGVVDHGTQTVHEIDPTQAIIFNPSAIKHIDVVQNKARLDMSKWQGQTTGDHFAAGPQQGTSPPAKPTQSTPGDVPQKQPALATQGV
jgi:hypothetical protein